MRRLAGLALLGLCTGCQAYSSNAGVVRAATAVGQEIVANANDLSLAPVPGAAGSPQAGNTTTPGAVDPNGIMVPGVPFTLRSALYEGGATATSGIVITLWSTPLSCTDYLANRIPAGASFVHIALPPLTQGSTGTFAIVGDVDTPTGEQAYTYLNTPTPQSAGGTQGSVTLSKVALGQGIEGTLTATLDDGSTANLSFVGVAAAAFCSL